MPDRQRIKTVLTTRWAWLTYGLLLGVFLILGIRLITYQPEHDTHFHANFAVYINGQREKFDAPRYYEEVKLCSMHDQVTPQSRVHMHNEENGVIHVHDDGVTWGQLFENLGWYIGPDFIRTPENLYVSDDTNRLNIVLNGDNLTGLSTITNELIGDRDRLLVSYGAADKASIDTQYKSVPASAGEYNNKPDPASCGGNHKATVGEKFRNLF